MPVQDNAGSDSPMTDADIDRFLGLVVTLGLTHRTRTLVSGRLADGASWETIAAEVNWDCETLKRHYGASF